MRIADLVLKAKVNLALVRDSRVGVLDIGVHTQEGIVTLDGDVDNEDSRTAAGAIASKVEGVEEVQNELTVGRYKAEDNAELMVQQLLNKLDGEWESLHDRTALAEADYLRWALWLIYKFRLPAAVEEAEIERIRRDAVEQALTHVSGHVGAPRAVVALEMIRQAEAIEQSGKPTAPDIVHAPLVATPVTNDSCLDEAA